MSRRDRAANAFIWVCIGYSAITLSETGNGIALGWLAFAALWRIQYLAAQRRAQAARQSQQDVADLLAAMARQHEQEAAS